MEGEKINGASRHLASANKGVELPGGKRRGQF